MATFITGAGLVGVYVAQRMVAEGEECTIFDVAPNPAYVEAIAGTKGIKLVRGDVRDLPALVQHSRGCQYFFHTAGLIGGSVASPPFTGWDINVNGTVNAAEAARLNDCRRLVFCSSHATLDLSGNVTEPVTEDYPWGVVGLYGASKIAGEALLQAYDKLYSTDYVSLRYPQAYGAGHYRGGSIGGEYFDELISNPWLGKPALVRTFVGGRNEYLYAKDVAQAVYKAFTSDKLQHRVFNVGTGVLSSHQDIIDAVRKRFPNAQYEFEEGAATARGYRTTPFDLSRTRAELGYEPEWDLERGIDDYFKELDRTAAALGRA